MEPEAKTILDSKSKAVGIKIQDLKQYYKGIVIKKKPSMILAEKHI